MEAALAHTVRNRVDAAYARIDIFEKRRELVESWVDYLALNAVSLIGGGQSIFQFSKRIGHCLDDRDRLNAHMDDSADGGPRDRGDRRTSRWDR